MTKASAQTFTGSVYLIINKINNMKYVGQTTRDIKIRFTEHYYNQRSYLGRSMRKYGKNNFKIVNLKIFSCNSREELRKQLDYWEIWYINYYNLVKTGYNCAYGGHTSEMTEETKNKIKKKLLCHPVSEETKNKIRKKLLGHLVSEETRKKLSLKNKGHFYGTPHKWADEEKSKKSFDMRGNTNRRLAVLQFDLEGNFIKEWSSITEANKFFSKNKNTHISSVCKGKRNTCFGYKWKYKL